MKKGICAALSVLFIFYCSGFAVLAAETNGISVYIDIGGLEGPPDITAQAAVLMDSGTGGLIYEKNSGKPVYPASTVKIMTAVVVLENVADLESRVEISKFVIQNASGNSLDPRVSAGEIFTVGDLLYGMLLRGANDAALALAEYTAGSITAFVDKMNAKAAELGCENTFFTNPTGMHSPEMHSTASDTAKITFYASKIHKFMDIAKSLRYEIPATNVNNERVLLNRNHFISKGQYSQYYYEYAKGINYGSTTEAGLCLTTLAEQMDLSYLAVVMGSTPAPVPETDDLILNCFLDARALFDWIFSLYSYRTAVSAASVVSSVGVKLAANSDVVTLVSDAEIQVLLPKNADMDKEVTLQKEIFDELLVAPIYKGDILGKITVLYKGEIVGAADLISTADVEHSNILYMLEKIKEAVSGAWFRASVIIFVIIFAFYLAVTLLHKNKSSRRRFY